MSGTARRIEATEARAFFEHPSQRKDFAPEDLPDHFEYWACGPLCGVFVHGLWYDTWNAHYGVKPEGWGSLTQPARAVLNTFWHHKGAKLITGYTAASNRAATAFAKRIGFFKMGTMPHPDGNVIMQGWTPCQ